MRIAVIGVGGQAKLHAERLRHMKSPALAYLAGRTREGGARLAAALNVEARTIAECLDDQTVDAVVVAVPTAVHRQITVAALRAGKHVLCESPFATTRVDADAMIHEARRARRHLLVGYVSPFDPEAVDIRSRIERGDIGELRLITTERLFGCDQARRTHHGDAVGELLTYDIQFFLWLFGALRLRSAEGVMRASRCGHVFTEFRARRVPLRCEASRLLPPSFPFTFRMKVIGTRGALVWRFALPPNAPPDVRYDRYGADGSRRPIGLKPSDALADQLKHFAAVIQGGSVNDRISADLARRTVACTEAVARAVRAGGRLR